METCDQCCGTGYSGHPDSGYTCSKCGGSGGLPVKMTPEQAKALRVIDKTGVIKVGDRGLLPGLHFCPEWDDMAIFDLSPEKGACLCHRTAPVTEKE